MAISIKTQGENLTMYQGSTFEQVFTAKNANNANVTISSGTCASKMKKNHSTTNTSFILTFSTSITDSNVTISATAAQTSAMPSGLYVYDVEYTQTDGVTKERIVEGMITILPEATT
tara:strand:+ start:3969 stop:4319 length:351 start_codon:yes stop_codon:yes gene_type:complete